MLAMLLAWEPNHCDLSAFETTVKVMFEIDCKPVWRRNWLFSYRRSCERFVSFLKIWLIRRLFIAALERFWSRDRP
jgi:hypothetical protein